MMADEVGQHCGPVVVLVGRVEQLIGLMVERLNGDRIFHVDHPRRDRQRGGRGREWVIPALIGALSDRAAWVRQTAALELGSIVKPGDRKAGAAVAALESRLVDPSPGVRVWACWSLTRLGRGRECIPVLIEALDESETTVRALAVATIADAGTGAAEAISALEARCRDEDNPIIRKEAEKALTYLRGGAESRGP
jgi:hypothetical protein